MNDATVIFVLLVYLEILELHFRMCGETRGKLVLYYSTMLVLVGFIVLNVYKWMS